MSVIVQLRAKGDPAALEKYAAANADQMKRIANEGKKSGAAHHLFAAGKGEIVVIDEWDSLESFQKFFQGQSEIPQMMAAAGITGEPEITSYRVLDTKDAF
jgi:heme-degrading monooxygenase HmoA